MLLSIVYTTAQVSDPATRNALVAGLNNGTETRARVKKIAESSAVANNQQLFFNRAYVLMQYFGYLRRNPDDAPDFNLNGYNFWLNDLNNGTKSTFEMVDAFISSPGRLVSLIRRSVRTSRHRTSTRRSAGRMLLVFSKLTMRTFRVCISANK